MARSTKLNLHMGWIILILIQVCQMSAEKMTEPSISDSDTDSMEDQQELIVSLDEKQFTEFVKEPSVRIVYFYTIDFSGLNNFLAELQSSATLMSPFGVKVGKVDCRISKVPDYCTLPEVHNKVYAFKSGGELLELLLVNMFDVNSIMSNVLQLVLLKEVPILQTKAELMQFEGQHKGKHDVIFSFQRSIGTYEHRILMEIAHGYHDQFAFALTTEEEVIKGFPDWYSHDDVAIWVGRCKDVAQDAPCQYTKYYDAMEIGHLASFLRLLNIQLLHDVGSKQANNPLADFDIHIAVIYYDKTSKEMTDKVGKELNSAFQGSIGVITVDLDKADGARFGFVKDLTQLPGIALFMKDEQHPHHLETSLSCEAAVRFCKAELEYYATKKGRKSPPKTQNDEVDEIAAVEKQDDAVAEAVVRLRGTPINRDHLPALTDKTFPLETNSRDVLMVLFYLNFDARGMAFLRSYSEAAEILAKEGAEPLAVVDCYDWTDVCGQQNITSYPTIRVFRKSQGFTVYNGPLDTKSVVTTMKLLLFPSPVHLKSENEVSKFIAGDIPSEISEFTPVSILGLFSSKHKKELQAFKKVSKTLHGKYLMGYASEDIISKLLKTYAMKGPGVVIYNREDPYKPHKVYEGEMSEVKLAGAINDAVLPVLPELTALNFPTYFAKKQPLVIFFANGGGTEEEGEVMRTLSELSVSKGELQVVYCWMKVDERDPLNVGRHVMLDYNPAAVAPALAMVNHATGRIYNYPKAEFEKMEVLVWIESALDGSVLPSKMLSEKEWKPMNPGYDFLSMIDQENEKQLHEKDRFRKNNRGKDLDDEDISGHSSNAAMDMQMETEMDGLKDEGSMLPHHTEL